MIPFAVLVSSFAYVGFVPFAPGTAGSVAGLAVWWVLTRTSDPTPLIVGIVVLGGLGVWAAGVAERHAGRTDPGLVVIDEVVGMLVTLAFVPVGAVGVLIGFLLFRLFDIVKPFPAGLSERLPRGWGIMTDDVIAGLYANLVLQLLVWRAPEMLA